MLTEPKRAVCGRGVDAKRIFLLSAELSLQRFRDCRYSTQCQHGRTQALGEHYCPISSPERNMSGEIYGLSSSKDPPPREKFRSQLEIMLANYSRIFLSVPISREHEPQEI